MSSSSDGDGAEEQFFETMEDIASTSASDTSDGELLFSRRGSSSSRNRQLQQQQQHPDAKYAVWTSDPASIVERRLKFFSKMGLEVTLAERRSRAWHSLKGAASTMSSATVVVRSSSDPCLDADKLSDSTIGSGSGRRDEVKELAYSSAENSAGLAEEGGGFDGGSFIDANKEFVCRIKDLDNGKEFVVHELGSDGLWNRLREVGTGKELSLEEFESAVGLSPIVTQVHRRGNAAAKVKQKRSWMRLLRGAVRRRKSNDSLRDDSSDISTSSSSKSPWKMQRVKVKICKKAVRELTELYMGQELSAHQGPVWALKFSSDGRFLASGGQDCVVRVWKVFTQSAPSGEASLEEIASPRKPTKRRNSGPKKKHASDEKVRLKTFSLFEKPVSSLYGHTEDILDLSWSPSEHYLLSSSMDTTVRLWDVEREECLRSFSHNDYVTCIEFNPMDGKHFLSGSLDGKVRIWSIVDHHVVDWTDLREIVTAASYTPDGSAAIIGTYKGVCRFYSTTDNKLVPDLSLDVLSKKGKKPRKKITGIQCMPGDPSKVLITSNDSRVRLFEGNELISKYKGFRNMSSQISASFSRNGNYIISASEDSHVYMWNVLPPSTASCRGHLKISEKSCESFLSDNVTVALPWSAQLEANSREQRQASEQHKKDESRALKVGGDILQLLKQTSFPGPCFDCLTVADSVDGGGTTVFPVNSDDATSVGGASSTADPESPTSTLSVIAAAAAAADPADPPAAAAADDGDEQWPSPLHRKVLEVPSSPNLDITLVKEQQHLQQQQQQQQQQPQQQQQQQQLASKGLGLVIVTASLSGEIRTFQNYGLPLHC